MISVTLLNSITLVLLALCTLGWRFIYPKKKVNLFLLLMIFSCIPLLSVWRTGSYESGDFKDHVYFFISFYRSLENGIWFPRWSGGFCNGYGYPHIQYFYHLPYYVASFFHYALNVSFVHSFKLLICVSFLGAAASMYLWLSSEWGKRAAFFGSILYILSPYLLAGTHFRITVGEGLGTFIVPLILWSIKKIFDDSSKKWLYYWLITFLYILLILSHHVVPVLCLPFIVSYFFFQLWRSKKINSFKIGSFFSSLFMAFLITSYHWVPILLESKWILQDQLRIILFPSVSAYFFSPWRFGLLNQGHHGELTWTVGYVQWFMVLLSFCSLCIKKIAKNDRYMLKFLLIWFISLFVFLLPFTQPFWVIMPIFNNFQFAIRLLFLINIIVAALAAILLKNAVPLYQFFHQRLVKSIPILPSKITQAQIITMMFLLICATCGATILNWGQRTVITDLDDQKLELLLPTWCDQVTIPNWLDEKTFKGLPNRKANLEIIAGTGFIEEKKRGMEERHYVVTASTPTALRENTTYFPGWTAYVDGRIVPIRFDDPIFYGIIMVDVPPGIHHLSFIYEYTAVQIMFGKISFISLGAWSIGTIMYLWKQLK